MASFLFFFLFFSLISPLIYLVPCHPLSLTRGGFCGATEGVRDGPRDPEAITLVSIRVGYLGARLSGSHFYLHCFTSTPTMYLLFLPLSFVAICTAAARFAQMSRVSVVRFLFCLCRCFSPLAFYPFSPHACSDRARYGRADDTRFCFGSCTFPAQTTFSFFSPYLAHLHRTGT